MAKPKQIVKIWKKGDFINRSVGEKWLSAQGYHLVSEEEIQQYSAGKGILLGLLFLPLALFGHTTRIKCTYERTE